MPEDNIVLKLDLIAKLLYIQTKPKISSLENSLVKTEKQKKLYDALDGKQNMNQLQEIAGISVKTMEPLLPEWEKRGLIISFGKGRSKKYISLQNLEI